MRVITNTDMAKEHAAEQEFLGMLVRVCRTVRSPKNPKNRVELSIPAARWEMIFSDRIKEMSDPGFAKRAPKIQKLKG